MQTTLSVGEPNTETKKKKYQSKIRVFKNPVLEAMTHVHPALPITLWGSVVLGLLYRSFFLHQIAVSSLIIFAFAGFFVWTLTEYFLHRFAFHYDAKTDFGKGVVFLAHGIHHDDPNDPTRLLIPPAPGIILAIVFYSLFRLILGDVFVDPFFAFFLVGYLTYDYIHYATHHFRIKSSLGKALKQHHMDHHFICHDENFGVSSPLWDVVFGTLWDRKKVKSH